MLQEVQKIQEIVNRHLKEECPPDPEMEKFMADFDAKLPLPNRLRAAEADACG